MQPWDKSCASLREQLDAWLHNYSTELEIRCFTPRQANRFCCATRLWHCWRHHWQQAVQASQAQTCDGTSVAEHLLNGRKHDGSGNLGGNPLRDVVLACAVQNRDPQATEYFSREYHDWSLRMAGAIHTRHAAHDDWYHDLVDRLAGYTNPPGKLGQFVGRCSLKTWLGTVVKNYVRGLPAAVAQSDDDEQQQERAAAGSATDELLSRECLQLFERRIAQAVAELPPDDRSLLYFAFVEQVPGIDLARMFGVDPGTITRRKTKALGRTNELLTQDESAQRGTYRDCLEQLFSGAQRQQFGEALCRALSEQAAGKVIA